MKVAVLVLALLLAFVCDRLVRTENQLYALQVGSCPSGIPGLNVPDLKCLSLVQTRTSWVWHLYSGLTADRQAVPMYQP